MLKRQAVHNVFSISLYNLNMYRNHNLFKLENFYSSSIQSLTDRADDVIITTDDATRSPVELESLFLVE